MKKHPDLAVLRGLLGDQHKQLLDRIEQDLLPPMDGFKLVHARQFGDHFEVCLADIGERGNGFICEGKTLPQAIQRAILSHKGKTNERNISRNR